MENYTDYDISIGRKKLLIRKYSSNGYLENVSFNSRINKPVGREWDDIKDSILHRKAIGRVSYYGEI